MFVTGRQLDADSLLTPHNGHLSVILVLLYVVILKVFGADGFDVIRILAIAVHLSIAYGAYLLVGRRKGWPLAMLSLVVVATLGSGWQNILWPFQIGMMLPVAMALFAVYVVETRPDATWSVGVLVSIALLSAGGGVALLLALIIHSVFVYAWRRSSLLMGIGLVYALWYASYGVPQGWGVHPWTFARYVGESAVLSAAAIGARGVRFGEAVLVCGTLAAVIRLRHQFRQPSILVPVLTVGIGWLMTAYSRWLLWEPGASRYVYVGAVLLLVVFLVAIPLPSPRWTIPGAAILAVVLVVPNISLMNGSARMMSDNASRVRAELAVIDAAGDRGLPSYQPDGSVAPQIHAGPYLEAAAKYGPFGIGVTDAQHLSNDDRTQMDRVAFQYLKVGASSVTGTSPPSECAWAEVDKGSETLLESDAVVLEVRSPVTLTLRMFADTATQDTTLTLDANGRYVVKVPRPETLPRWRFSASVPLRVGVCEGLGAQG